MTGDRGAAVRFTALNIAEHLDQVAAFYTQAPDYWVLAEGGRPDPYEKAEEFFTAGAPGCDIDRSRFLGLFLGGHLSGLAELHHGFPKDDDAYLGLMILGPWAQGVGYGTAFLSEIEGLARSDGATKLYVGVLEANPRGRAFWQREGFSATGVTKEDNAHGLGHVLHRLVKPL
ncbi:GNAT family N-acetyltransferase [Limimaricola variabilis]|uniref:GNAT family N-acetyltransferase n=1 Tax=Limimaricola variabilis TaxID=1492771 RepID=UPI002AC95760|nr:GNAT family N-acetyltransferase [Limimaricola variabilis]WPY94764.1 GNAT family N-acetyltransferase [Limimaricola variabilis]